MPKISDFVPPAIPFLSSDEKAEIADAQTPFQVVNVAWRADDEYGPSWVLTLSFDDGRLARLSLRDSPSRQATYEKLVEFVSPDNPVGPAVLSRHALKGGKTFWTLEDADAVDAD